MYIIRALTVKRIWDGTGDKPQRFAAAVHTSVYTDTSRGTIVRRKKEMEALVEGRLGRICVCVSVLNDSKSNMLQYETIGVLLCSWILSYFTTTPRY